MSRQSNDATVISFHEMCSGQNKHYIFRNESRSHLIAFCTEATPGYKNWRTVHIPQPFHIYELERAAWIMAQNKTQ